MARGVATSTASGGCASRAGVVALLPSSKEDIDAEGDGGAGADEDALVPVRWLALGDEGRGGEGGDGGPEPDPTDTLPDGAFAPPPRAGAGGGELL
jgi:hypothetical protein